MANYELLKQGLVAVIKENGNQEITGQLLQQQLLAIINSLGAGYLLIGAATPTTNPGTPDQNVAYLAVEPGTYTNFGGLVVTDPLVLLKWNGQWSQETLSTGIKVLFAAVISDIDDINAAIVAINATILSLQNNKADKNGWYNGLVAGAAENLIGQMPASAFFTYRQTDDGKAGTGAAQIQTIKGRTLKWNQLEHNSDLAEYTAALDGLGTQNQNIRTIIGPVTNGHKFLICFFAKSSEPVSGSIQITDGLGLWESVNLGTSYQMFSLIVTISRTTSALVSSFVRFSPTTASSASITTKGFNRIDLTNMFGGNYEPMVAEFTELFPKLPYANNAGTLLPFKGTAIKTTGFNQWDEQWELGSISDTTGQNTLATNQIRSKNYIPVLPGSTYYLEAGNMQIRQRFYDANKAYIGLSGQIVVSGELTVPANCRYIRIIAYTTAYENNICFSISDPTKNGTYEPYQENTLNIDVIGKAAKDSNNNAIVPFPTSVNGVGSVLDEYGKDGGVKRFGVVDLGDLSWEVFSTDTANKKRFGCTLSLPAKYDSASSVPLIVCPLYSAGSNENTYAASVYDKIVATRSNGGLLILDSAYTDADTFKAAMSGVYLVYELATPIPFTWDEPLPLNYPVNRLGTELLEPTGVDENGVPQTAPLTAEIIYPIDAIGTLLGLPQDYISQGSDINMLEAMKSAGLITAYTRTFNATTGKYEYTFTV